jgi:hypothetical protein
MIDLYALYEEKAQDGLLTIHPSRWLYAGRQLGCGGVFDLLFRENQAIRVGDQIVQHFRQLYKVDWWYYGKTPMRTFLDSLDLAKEKLISH